jgi:hypothetical protein
MAEPILHEGALVTLDVGAETTLLPCRVVGLTGDELALLPTRPPNAPIWRELARRGTVLVHFEVDGHLRALRGTAAGVRTGGYLAVRLTDDFRLGQRRRHSRAPLAFPATLTDPVDGEGWASETMDISGTGLRVQRPADTEEPARAGTVTLALPDGEVVAQASLVNAAPEWLSYRLDRLGEADRQRVASLVLAYHRQQLRGA